MEDVYYGTKREDLVRKIELEPLYNTGKIFEFGMGVYFTDDKEIAEQYIRGNAYYSIAEGNELEGEVQEHIGYLHTFTLNLNIFKESHLTLGDDSMLKDELVNTLKQYRKNGIKNGYIPDRYFTFGELIGKPWDDLAENIVDIGIEKFSDAHIVLIVENLIKQKNTRIKTLHQYCIHKGKIVSIDFDRETMHSNYISLKSSEMITYGKKI